VATYQHLNTFGKYAPRATDSKNSEADWCDDARSVNTTVKHEEWADRWSKANEKTSSS